MVVPPLNGEQREHQCQINVFREEVRQQDWTGVRPYVRVVMCTVQCAIALEIAAWD